MALGNLLGNLKQDRQLAHLHNPSDEHMLHAWKSDITIFHTGCSTEDKRRSIYGFLIKKSFFLYQSAQIV